MMYTINVRVTDDSQCFLSCQDHNAVDQIGRYHLQPKHDEVMYQFVGPDRSVRIPKTDFERILECQLFSAVQHFTPSHLDYVSLGYVVARHQIDGQIPRITIRNLM